MDVVLGNSDLGPLRTALRIWKHEGLRGFWRGNGLNIMRNAPFKAVNYFAFDMYTKALFGLTGTTAGHVERFVAGAMAGVTGVITCFPLDTIRTRLLAPNRKKYMGVLDCMSKTVRLEGAGSLYRGVPVTLLSIAPSSAVFYGVYHLLKEAHISRTPGSSTKNVNGLDAFHGLLFGAIAGACAEATVYPLEVIRRRMQMQHGSLAGSGLHSFHVRSHVKDISKVCGSIIRKHGFGGFYAGIVVNTMQVLPNAALSYYIFETLKTHWGVNKHKSSSQ